MVVKAMQGKGLKLAYRQRSVINSFNFNVVGSIAVEVEDEGTPRFIITHNGVVGGDNHPIGVAKMDLLVVLFVVVRDRVFFARRDDADGQYGQSHHNGKLLFQITLILLVFHLRL